MTWLTPLFLAAGVAVVGPILFHMWQRTPRGRRLFSSTMFLAASPPRITHRSRIENWPLLILRACALLLLALGFARPVWRTETQAPTITSPDQTVAILFDLSASLQRTGFRDALLGQVTKRLEQLPASAHVGVFAFDHSWKSVVSFEEADRLDQSARRLVVRERLAALRPGWGSTRLGDGLAQTMQALREYETTRPAREAAEVWLASDLASGADLSGLAGIDWPETTRLEIITPDVDPGTNAGLQWVESRADAQEAELRVRITNSKKSVKDRFQIGWDDATEEQSRVDVHVPAGQSRTILAPSRPEGVSEAVPLRLFGDDHDFDNRLWSAENRRRAIWILYLGNDAAEDPSGPRFFLEQALAGASEAEISIRTSQEVDDVAVSDNPPALAVWTETDADPPGWLPGVLERGGSLLAVPQRAEEARLMLAYQGLAAADVQEAPVKDFSLLGDIDFEDPLFASFAQARFADFTGIHFWKHRRVRLPEASSWRILARFDDGDPFLMQQPVGKGRRWLLTSGWQPADSQLARSSKFAPLLHGLLEQSTPLTTRSSRADVGTGITWTMVRGQGPLAVRRPDHSVDEQPESAAAYQHTEAPGIYVATRNGESESWAINVAAEESKTDPLPMESLERLGVLTKRPSSEPAPIVSPMQQRQLQLEELERRQAWWQWCLLAAGAVLLIETAWAAKKSQVSEVPTSS